ncbi:hypothetical protein JFU48_21050 [Pseudomonas sp. TH49]|uniref:hypothetical protein n=1 Tax=Pseudomonas sp. TH49 TaxID=2796413 RepID=UPI0019127133|nr:hypothetical protein [Pseudomonas sp. TH49]MBK5343865.1 hypothetical protein [Pseudomonas sp. TH49]
MNDDRKVQALSAWRKLLEEPEIRMDAEEQYDELLKLADEYKRASIIDGDDWRELVEEATAFYAHSVEGLEGGT